MRRWEDNVWQIRNQRAESRNKSCLYLKKAILISGPSSCRSFQLSGLPRRGILQLVVGAALCSLISALPLPAAEHVPQRVLVKFKSGTTQTQRNAAISNHQSQTEKILDGLDVHVLKLPPGVAESAVVEALK